MMDNMKQRLDRSYKKRLKDEKQEREGEEEEKNELKTVLPIRPKRSMSN